MDYPTLHASIIRSIASPTRLSAFLNAVAFGLVIPLLYYSGDLSDGTVIGLLITFDSVGRIIGGMVLNRARQRLPAKWIHLIWQMMGALAFVLLAFAGHFHGGHLSAFAVLFLFSAMSGFSMSRFSSVRFLLPLSSGSDSTSTFTLVGFILGCALCAIPAGHRQATTFALATDIQTVPAACAAVLCALTGLVPLLWSDRASLTNDPFSAEADSASLITNWWQRDASLSVLLACEAAFAITICVEPLMGWESFGISAAGIASYFALGGCVSLAVRNLKVPLNRFGTGRSPCLGILFLALSSCGFTISCTLSRSIQASVHLASLMFFYFAVMLTAISHGLLQVPLPVVAARLSRFNAGIMTSNLQRDQMVCVVSSVAALGVSVIWAAHERITFLLPAVLSAGAMIIAVFPTVALAARRASTLESKLESTPKPGDGRR